MNSQQRRLRRRLLGRQADDFQSHISRSGKDNFWKFTSLTVGNFEFSIQGSRAHYSKPRELADPKIYTEMEVAIFDSKGNWCVLSDYDSIQTQVQFETYSRTTSVAPYVKVEAIQTMLNGVAVGSVQPIKLSDYWHIKEAHREIEAIVNNMDV
jgi:hypothetical protein